MGNEHFSVSTDFTIFKFYLQTAEQRPHIEHEIHKHTRTSKLIETKRTFGLSFRYVFFLENESLRYYHGEG